MILLLGGTSDALPIAEGLVQKGYRVLISKATDVPLPTGDHPNMETRCGPLDETSLAELIEERGVLAIVDATHPYATAIRGTASRVAQQKGVPCLSFLRPPAVSQATPGVELVPDHATAAAAAFSHGRPVLLTTGTRNLAPYAKQSQRTGLPLIVRTLNHAASLGACRNAGIPIEHILACRGPFSVAENRRHIRMFQIGVLVSKDSGTAGGTAEKLEAARAEGCHVIVVVRPKISNQQTFSDVPALLEALAAATRTDI
jgi:precorrin-6A/cobalt-precorrin-6A reductase